MRSSSKSVKCNQHLFVSRLRKSASKVLLVRKGAEVPEEGEDLQDRREREVNRASWAYLEDTASKASGETKAWREKKVEKARLARVE